MVGRLASQALSYELHAFSDGHPAPVVPSPVYILYAPPRPEPELDEVGVYDEGGALEAGEEGEEACDVGLVAMKDVSGA